MSACPATWPPKIRCSGVLGVRPTNTSGSGSSIPSTYISAAAWVSPSPDPTAAVTMGSSRVGPDVVHPDEVGRPHSVGRAAGDDDDAVALAQPADRQQR